MPSQPTDTSYVAHVANLERLLKSDDALRRAVGGEFVAIGKLEHQLLRSLGLTDGNVVVDVGCGSGRLACQLAGYPNVRYFGFDVVPRLLAYAADLCQRPDWTFATTDGDAIAVPSGVADFVCFFSVFTHLPQEQTFRYIRDAYRVLKPGGRLVASFLQFGISGHWDTFLASVNGTRADSHQNEFFGPDAVRAWAEHAGFRVMAIHPGDTNYIPLAEDVRFDNGAVASGYASLGQSVAVLQKPALPTSVRATAPLLNASFRASVAPGGCLQAGFVVGGAGPATALVRAVGPGLSNFGVQNCLPRPVLTVIDAQGQRAEYQRWQDTSEMQSAVKAVGAFPLPAGSDDVAAVIVLQPGQHSAIIKSADPAGTGEVLLEVYILDHSH